MATPGTPSHNDAQSIVITPGMLENARPDDLRRLDDTDTHAVFAYSLDMDEDDLLMDCFVSAAGVFFGEEDFEGAELLLLVAHDGSEIKWRVQGPGSHGDIGRIYTQPAETANAVRFIENYMELGIQLPLIPVRLSDSIAVDEGVIQLNGRPMALACPAEATPVDIMQDPEGASMGCLSYKDSQDTLSKESVDNIVLRPE